MDDDWDDDWDDWDDLEPDDDPDDDLSAWEIMCAAQPPEPLPPPMWRPDDRDPGVLVPDDGHVYALTASVTLARTAGQRPLVGLQIVTDDGEAVACNVWASPGITTSHVRALVNRPGRYRLAVLGERAASPFCSDRALTAEDGGPR